jgi:cytochrome bd-type quinol oxidase subunit 2
VAFAPPSFADTFSKLVFFNILLPILILCIAIYADKHAGGQFNKTASRYLLIIRRILRIWFVALGVLYAIFYLSGRNTLDSHLRLQEVMLVAIPLIYILVCFLVLKKKNDANDTSAALWALYSIQWSLFVFQIGVFLSTIRNQNIDASLKEILFGKNWHTSKFIEDLASGNWEHGTNFPGGASYIILFWTLALLFLYRVPYRLRQYAKALEDNKNKAEELDKLRLQPIHIVVTTAVLVGIMFYFSILGFSRYVYPYIPSSKGGGDFTKSPQTHLTFNADGSAQYVSSYLPTNLIAINATNGLIILYENRDYAYLACRGDASGPMNWQSTASRPKVYEVPRKFITCVEYSNVFANVSNMISLHVSAPPRAKLSH